MPRFAIAPLGLTTEGSTKFKLKGWKCYLKKLQCKAIRSDQTCSSHRKESASDHIPNKISLWSAGHITPRGFVSGEQRQPAGERQRFVAKLHDAVHARLGALSGSPPVRRALVHAHNLALQSICLRRDCLFFFSGLLSFFMKFCLVSDMRGQYAYPGPCSFCLYVSCGSVADNPAEIKVGV